MNLIKKTCELKSCVDEKKSYSIYEGKKNLNRIDGFD